MSNNDQSSKKSEFLRVHLKKGQAGLDRDSDIMVDQIRSINNDRLIRKLGKFPDNLIEKVKENVKIVLDLE